MGKNFQLVTAEQEKELRAFLTTGLWGWLSRTQAHDAGLAEEAAGDARPASLCSSL